MAREREWLVTNGIGGFAMGTVPGVLTRRYHGLLIAALEPPLGRTLRTIPLGCAASMIAWARILPVLIKPRLYT